MPRKKRLIYEIKNYLAGNFRLPEMSLLPGQHGRKLKLCTIEEADYKIVDGEKIRRSEREKAEYINTLYRKKEEQIRGELNNEAAYRDSVPIKRIMKKWLEYQQRFRAKDTYQRGVRTCDMYLRVVGNHSVGRWKVEYHQKFTKYLANVKPDPTKERYSLASQNTYITYLQTFFNWAYQHQYTNQSVKLSKVSVPQKPIRTYTAKQLQSLGKHIYARYESETHSRRKQAHLIAYRIYIMALYTLMRVGAIWSLRLDHIDLRQGIIQIRNNDELGWRNKKDQQKDKPIHPKLLQFSRQDIANRIQTEVYYLDNLKGKPYYTDIRTISTRFTKYNKQLGITGIKPLHGIRATGATQLLSQGIDIRTVQLLLDHSNISTTIRYDDREHEIQKKAIKKLKWPQKYEDLK